MDRKQHWENVYQTKCSTEVSWYEPDPKQSLDMILQVSGEERGRVLDVGGGQSLLVDRLLDAGFAEIAVLDISYAAIEATKLRLGKRSNTIKWIASDITQANSVGEFDIWHDRAVLHFLTDIDDQRRYVELLKNTLSAGGHFIIGAFAKGGPEKCSGLQIQQYDEQAMRNLLGNDFEHVQSLDYLHTTPTGKSQQFYFGVFQCV